MYIYIYNGDGRRMRLLLVVQQASTSPLDSRNGESANVIVSLVRFPSASEYDREKLLVAALFKVQLYDTTTLLQSITINRACGFALCSKYFSTFPSMLSCVLCWDVVNTSRTRRRTSTVPCSKSIDTTGLYRSCLPPYSIQTFTVSCYDQPRTRNPIRGTETETGAVIVGRRDLQRMMNHRRTHDGSDTRSRCFRQAILELTMLIPVNDMVHKYARSMLPFLSLPLSPVICRLGCLKALSWYRPCGSTQREGVLSQPSLSVSGLLLHKPMHACILSK